MGWLHVILPALAAFYFYKTDHNIWFYVSIIAVIGSFWSWGIMHNYAVQAAKRRENYSGKFYDFTRKEAVSVPNWISTINMLFAILGLICFISFIVFRFF